MVSQRESLLSPSAVKLYGRVVLGLDINIANARDELGGNKFLRSQLEPATKPKLARVMLPAPPGLSAGERLIASVTAGDAATGVVVPRAAVVLAGGEAWSYVQAADDEFVRRRVDIARPAAQGYFQEAGFDPHERVVVAGAGLLLAREIGGGAEAED